MTVCVHHSCTGTPPLGPCCMRSSRGVNNQPGYMTECNETVVLMYLQDTDGQSMIDKLFGVKLHVKLKCEETDEEFEVSR